MVFYSFVVCLPYTLKSCVCFFYWSQVQGAIKNVIPRVNGLVFFDENIKRGDKGNIEYKLGPFCALDIMNIYYCYQKILTDQMFFFMACDLCFYIWKWFYLKDRYTRIFPKLFKNNIKVISWKWYKIMRLKMVTLAIHFHHNKSFTLEFLDCLKPHPISPTTSAFQQM